MGQKLTDRTELAEAPASGDFFHVVDVSDTTDSAEGTSKKVQAQYLTIADASDTVKGKVELATTAETETGTDATRAVTPDAYRDAFATTEAAIVHAATEKTTPVDADELGLIDSAASYVLKKLTWANLKATLKTYLDTLYPPQNGWVSYSTVVPTRASADDPTYVLTFAGVDLTSTMSVGMKVKWTQNATVRYGIVTAISFSTNTTLTIYGGTDYDVDDTATYAISAFNYSTQKAPLSFPLDPTKWTVTATDTTTRAQATPTQNTWYNLGTFTSAIPIGVWNTSYFVNIQVNDVTAGNYEIAATLSTANNSETDKTWTIVYNTASPANSAGGAMATRTNTLVLAAKTSYYLNTRTVTASVDNIYNRNTDATAVIKSVCAYL